MPLREVVCDPGEPLRFVHFPVTGLMSSIIVFHDGAAVEAATIGNEGMSGIALLVGERASPFRVIQQIEGESLRIAAAALKDVLAESPGLRELMARYALTLMQQSAQTAACNLRHPVRERMCRWLLASADRIGREEFALTQEFMAVMLGVRRQSVSVTAVELQEEGLITYRRGKLRIVDRVRLERSACECFRASRDAYERMMRLPADAIP